MSARDTNFYYSFLVLPAEKRRAIVAVWDFCRAVDDATDEVGAGDERRAADELALVRRGGRSREMRDVAVGQLRLRLDVLRQAAEAGAQHDADLGGGLELRFHIRGSFLDLIVKFGHGILVQASADLGGKMRGDGII